MKFRSTLVLLSAVAGLTVGTLAPAQAAPADPVTNLGITVTQTIGSNTGWNISTSWTGNPEATAYSVVIADHEDGTLTAGKHYGSKDTAATSAVISTSNLVAGLTYWVSVQPIAPATGTVLTAPFVPPALDTTAPSGTYRLNRTSGYLGGMESLFEGSAGRATFTITQTGIDSGAVTRSVVPGDGSAAIAWRSSGSFPLSYTRTGTFTPKVRLTDVYGNTRDVALPKIRVRNDRVNPKISITRPTDPGKIASWRIVRGTASDAGIGLEMVGTFVAQKRGNLWWTYDFASKKWLKGYAGLGKTMAKSDAEAAYTIPTRSGAWRSPAIKGITRGALHVEAVAIDGNFNVTLAKVDQKVG